MRLADLQKYDKITIQCHDNPDADALASGYGLYCYFSSKNKDVRLVYSGRFQIEKSNLRLMVDKLKLPVEYVAVERGESIPVEGLLITVDCQYGAGNVTGLSSGNVAIIDHHQAEKKENSMSVINPSLGSCSTLVWKLLREEDFDVNECENLGTALYYGLYTDTNSFSELYNPLDMDMREAVNADKALITLFRNSNISLKELEIAGIALIRYTYNEEYGFAVIKSQPCDPNILGLISDFLLQVDIIKTCVVFNETNDGYKFSVRSCVREVNASELAGFLSENIGSGGGHYEKAGGFVSKRRYSETFSTLHIEAYFNYRMTEYFDAYDLIYAEDYQVDPEGMKQYLKRSIPVGYVKASDVLPVGTPITVRTLEGDLDLRVKKDIYIMIGIKGEAYPISRERFENSYKVTGEKYRPSEDLEYLPTIKDRLEDRTLILTDYASVCIPTQKVKIYARELTKGAKVFTDWDKDKYMLGKPGDYLAVRCDDLHDIYIVERDIFGKSYGEPI